MYVQLARINGSGARSTTSSVRRRVVEFWVAAHANRWVLATAATGRRQRPHLWVQTVAEGVVVPKEGCQAMRVFFRSLSGVARLAPGVGKIGAPSDILPWEPQHLLKQLAASMSAPAESTTSDLCSPSFCYSWEGENAGR